MTPWRIRSLLSLSIVLFDSGGAVARTRLQVPEFDQLCDDCQRRNTPLKADNNAAHPTPPTSPAACFSRLCGKRLSRPGPFRTALTRTRNRFPQQEVFDDQLPFAGNERSAANTACDFESDGLRPRFGFDDLVKGVAAWAAKKRSRVGTGHNDATATDRANSNRS